ncbi:MAG: hypothetical protein AAGJ35_03035, partial [Myxococcota bacterium]
MNDHNTSAAKKGLFFANWIQESGKCRTDVSFLDGLDVGVKIQVEICTIGVPREPWDFLQRAVKTGHPRSIAIHLTEQVQSMLRDNFCKSPTELMRVRIAFLDKWSKRA